MSLHPITRRDFSICLGSALPLLGVARPPFAFATRALQPPAAEEISRTAEAIHQELLFQGAPKRVYEALTDTAQFDKVTRLSAAMKSGMPPGAKPTEISREPGGAFSAFGGYISGRQIELVPNERIVQAWRAGSWNPGEYSIAKFQLAEQGSNTKLVLDHTGFPEGAAVHLAEGWHANYWEPLQKFLAG